MYKKAALQRVPQEHGFEGTTLKINSKEMPTSAVYGSAGNYNDGNFIGLNATSGSPTYPAEITIVNNSGKNINGFVCLQYSHNISQSGDCRAYRGYQYKVDKGIIGAPIAGSNVIVLPEYEYINAAWTYTKESSIMLRLDEFNGGPLLPGYEITIRLGTVVRHEMGGSMSWNLSSCAIRAVLNNV